MREFREWSDGNPDNEDRCGLFVCFDGEKIRLANSEDPKKTYSELYQEIRA